MTQQTIDSYKTFSVWHDDFGLTLEEVRDRILALTKCDCLSSELWAEMQYWCVLFYGQPIFE